MSEKREVKQPAVVVEQPAVDLQAPRELTQAEVAEVGGGLNENLGPYSPP